MAKKNTKASRTTKAVFTKLAEQIKVNCHAIVDQAAAGDTDAMFLVMQGPMNVVSYAAKQAKKSMALKA